MEKWGGTRAWGEHIANERNRAMRKRCLRPQTREDDFLRANTPDRGSVPQTVAVVLAAAPLWLPRITWLPYALIGK